jgi:hypothetical protein
MNIHILKTGLLSIIIQSMIFSQVKNDFTHALSNAGVLKSTSDMRL